MRPDGLKVREIVTALERGRDLTREASDRSDADAALIAAAPELLAALEEVLPYVNKDGYGYEFEEGECPVCDRARAAIAKAKGDAA